MFSSYLVEIIFKIKNEYINSNFKHCYEWTKYVAHCYESASIIYYFIYLFLLWEKAKSHRQPLVHVMVKHINIYFSQLVKVRIEFISMNASQYESLKDW